MKGICCVFWALWALPDQCPRPPLVLPPVSAQASRLVTRPAITRRSSRRPEVPRYPESVNSSFVPSFEMSVVSIILTV